MKHIIIHGYDTCVFFYRACIYAAILKKNGICEDYEIKSYASRDEYKRYLESIPFKHETSPLVIDDSGNYIGGCDSLKEIVKSHNIECSNII